MKTNTLQKTYTHEGAKASILSPKQELQRTIMACLLWENQFYESGEDIASRIQSLVGKVDYKDVAAMALEARSKYRLRHTPLFLMAILAKQGKLSAQDLTNVIQRADELTEFMAMYWINGKCPISRQVKLGLAKAFNKFDEYQLAKYDRPGKVRLKDVMFMVHPKPIDKEQESIWKRLASGNLHTPDTWEVALSAGNDKKQTFTRLLAENKLGYMALLRNLRNMKDADVDQSLVHNALINGAKNSKALPFRFIAAAQAVPQWEPMLDQAMQLATKDLDKLQGKTLLLVDVSGSMDNANANKSKMTRMDAAAALAILVSAVSEDCHIFSFSNNLATIPNRKGMALRDAIISSQYHQGTYLQKALHAAKEITETAQRTIIITDEQAHDGIEAPLGKGYVLNVGSCKNGVGYGQYTHISGFSEQSVRYITEIEK